MVDINCIQNLRLTALCGVASDDGDRVARLDTFVFPYLVAVFVRQTIDIDARFAVNHVETTGDRRLHFSYIAVNHMALLIRKSEQFAQRQFVWQEIR